MNTYKKIIAAYQALGEGRVAEIDLVAKVKELFPGTIGVQDALMDMEAGEEARLWHDGTWTIEVDL